MRRTRVRMRLCIALLILNLVFIWGNSLMPGSVSGAISQWLQGLLQLENTGQAGHGLLRKLAHFLEFACLGVCFTWLYAMLRKTPYLALLCGGLAACVDEAIQCFVPDRGPGFMDVAIDTAGVAAGIGLLLLGHTIYKKKNISNFGGYEI